MVRKEAQIMYEEIQMKKKKIKRQLNSDWDGIYAHRCKLGRKVVGAK